MAMDILGPFDCACCYCCGLLYFLEGDECADCAGLEDQTPSGAREEGHCFAHGDGAYNSTDLYEIPPSSVQGTASN
jgi:hypothetical protein